jgi:hypothetical protein
MLAIRIKVATHFSQRVRSLPSVGLKLTKKTRVG